MPMTCAGPAWSRAAISVMEIELVLVARMAAGVGDPVELLEERELDVGSLGRRLDHHLAPRRRRRATGAVVIRPSTSPACAAVSVPFLTWRSRLPRMVASAPVERRLRHVDQRHLPAVLREDVGDPVAHGARADHRRLLHVALSPFVIHRDRHGDRASIATRGEQSALGPERPSASPRRARPGCTRDRECRAAIRSPAPRAPRAPGSSRDARPTPSRCRPARRTPCRAARRRGRCSPSRAAVMSGLLQCDSPNATAVSDHRRPPAEHARQQHERHPAEDELLAQRRQGERARQSGRRTRTSPAACPRRCSSGARGAEAEHHGAAPAAAARARGPARTTAPSGAGPASGALPRSGRAPSGR